MHPVGARRRPARAAAPTEEMSEEAGTSLAALVRAAARRRPDAPAVVAGDQRLTWAELDAAVDRAAAGVRRARPRPRRPGRRPAAQRPGLAAGVAGRAARRAGRRPGEHRLHRPRARVRARRLRRRACSSPPPSARRWPASRSAPGRRTADGPAARGAADDPAAPAFLAYTSGTTGRPARRDAHRRRAAGQPGAVPGDGPAAGPRGRPRAARPAAVPRLRPQRRLRPGRRHRRLRGAAGDLRPARLARRSWPRSTSPRCPGRRRCTRPGWPRPTRAAATPSCAAAFAAMRMASSGAAPLPEEIWTAMRDRAAVTVWEGYGLTEAAPVVASTLATGRAKPKCIGGPLPGVELGAARHRRPPSRRRRRRPTPTTTSRGPGRDLGPRPQPVLRVLARRRRRPGRRRLAAAPATSPTATPTATCTWSTGAAT